MTNLIHYEAPTGQALDGLVDPIDMPQAIRVIARPNSTSIHALTVDLMRGLGATRDLYSSAQGASSLLSAASAWCLAREVTDVFIGEIQDMDRAAILDSLDFTQRVGATLHLVSAFGEAAVHSRTLEELGCEHRPFHALPDLIQHPVPPEDPDAAGVRDVPDWSNVVIPEDDWISFRPTYHAVLSEGLATYCDRIYLDVYTRTRSSKALSEAEIALAISDAWETHGADQLPAIVAVRAVQAALFRNGLNVRVELRNLERAIKTLHLNPLTNSHYRDLTSYSDPWRAAATVLHAHHVGTQAALALRAFDVQPDGTVPSLGIEMGEGARLILAAQRWRQIIVGSENPPLFDKTAPALRQGIRRVVSDLGLPLMTAWRGQKQDRWQHNYGLKITRIA